MLVVMPRFVQVRVHVHRAIVQMGVGVDEVH
jgi:hypothetical protein